MAFLASASLLSLLFLPTTTLAQALSPCGQPNTSPQNALSACCPNYNGKADTFSNGGTYKYHCDSAFKNSLYAGTATDPQTCAQACSADSNCVATSWDPAPKRCWFIVVSTKTGNMALRPTGPPVADCSSQISSAVSSAQAAAKTACDAQITSAVSSAQAAAETSCASRISAEVASSVSSALAAANSALANDQATLYEFKCHRRLVHRGAFHFGYRYSACNVKPERLSALGKVLYMGKGFTQEYCTIRCRETSTCRTALHRAHDGFCRLYRNQLTSSDVYFDMDSDIDCVFDFPTEWNGDKEYYGKDVDKVETWHWGTNQFTPANTYNILKWDRVAADAARRNPR